MAGYNTIRGLRVKYLSANPSNPETGEVWYNSTSGTLKAEVKSGVWSSGGTASNLTSAALSGTQTAAIAGFGYDYGPPGAATTISEEYNGTSWTGGGTGNTPRYQLNQSGPQTATMALGGATGAPTMPAANAAEDYNGTGWTTVANLPATRAGGIPMCGPSDTLLATGGTDNMSGEPIDTTFEFSSGSWTTGTVYPAAQKDMGAVGTQTAAFFYGGSTDAPAATVTANTFDYDGSSWTANTALPTASRNWGGRSGTQTACVAACGTPGPGSPNPFSNTTLTWDGSAWATSAATTANTYNGISSNMSGTNTASLIAHTGGPSLYLKTEEYTFGPLTQTITTS